MQGLRPEKFGRFFIARYSPASFALGGFFIWIFMTHIAGGYFDDWSAGLWNRVYGESLPSEAAEELRAELKRLGQRAKIIDIPDEDNSSDGPVFDSTSCGGAE